MSHFANCIASSEKRDCDFELEGEVKHGGKLKFILPDQDRVRRLREAMDTITGEHSVSLPPYAVHTNFSHEDLRDEKLLDIRAYCESSQSLHWEVSIIRNKQNISSLVNVAEIKDLPTDLQLERIATFFHCIVDVGRELFCFQDQASFGMQTFPSSGVRSTTRGSRNFSR